jgi:hypothetical protein
LPGYLIDDKAAGRLGDMLRDYEGGQFSDGRTGDKQQRFGSSTPPVNVVLVTGSQNAAGYWPGVVRFWDNVTKAYSSGSTCRIREINNASLSQIQYLGRLAGRDEAGSSQADPVYPVYLVQARVAQESGSGVSGSGSSGTSGTSGSGSGSDSGSGSTSGSTSGSISGSGVSGSVTSGSSGVSGGSGGSGSGGSGGSNPCVSGQQGNYVCVEVVTNVQCIDGNIVVTKRSICIPGGVLC